MNEYPSNFIEKSEGKLKEGKARDFFELSEEEKKDLKQNIAKFNGTVRVFVHPIYTKYDPPQNPRDSSRAERVEMGLTKLLTLQQSSKVPPLFIMEEKENIEKTNQFLNEKISMLPEIYYIPTEIAVSIPKLPTQFRRFFDQASKEKKHSWGFLTKQFKDLEIKKILIGGMYLWLDGQGGGNGGQGQGCLGNAIKEFSNDFQVELSNFTNPDSRKDLRELKKK